MAELLLKEANLTDEYYGSVLNFVVNSELFQEKRHEYELKIVKWQIQWIAGGGENWICDENYGGDIMFLTPVCDLGFRKAVIDTLSAIGMNKEDVNSCIRITFGNETQEELDYVCSKLKECVERLRDFSK